MPNRALQAKAERSRRQAVEFAHGVMCQDIAREGINPSKAELRAQTEALIQSSDVRLLRLKPGKVSGLYAGKDVGLIGKGRRYRALTAPNHGTRYQIGQAPVSSEALAWAASRS